MAKKATKDKVKSTTRTYVRDALGRFARTSDSGSFKGKTKAKTTKVPVAKTTKTKAPSKVTSTFKKLQLNRETAISKGRLGASTGKSAAQLKALNALSGAVTQKDSDPTGLKKTRAKKDTTKTKDKTEVKQSVKKATKTAVATTQGKLLTERLDKAYAKNEAIGQAISKKQSATVAAVKQARKAGDDTTADKLKATLPKLLEQETRNSKRYHQLRRLDPRLNSDLKNTAKPVKETAKQTKAKTVGKAAATKTVAKKAKEVDSDSTAKSFIESNTKPFKGVKGLEADEARAMSSLMDDRFDRTAANAKTDVSAYTRASSAARISTGLSPVKPDGELFDYAAKPVANGKPIDPMATAVLKRSLPGLLDRTDARLAKELLQNYRLDMSDSDLKKLGMDKEVVRYIQARSLSILKTASLTDAAAKRSYEGMLTKLSAAKVNSSSNPNLGSQARNRASMKFIDLQLNSPKVPEEAKELIRKNARGTFNPYPVGGSNTSKKVWMEHMRTSAEFYQQHLEASEYRAVTETKKRRSKK
jgi:hypothetical protein